MRATLLFGLVMLACAGCCAATEVAPQPRTKQATLEYWRQRRFGIFLHWGPSSVLELGSGSWARKGSPGFPQQNQTQATAPAVISSGAYLKFKGQGGGVPQEVYDNLFHVFDPAAFNAREWVRLFKEAGAGYVVFTAKHHDGFCMFDTKTQDYNITHTPFRRDVCRELADACRAEGLLFLFYYSPPDWWNPGWIGSRKDGSYVDSHFLPQVEELLTNYGPLDGLWWDGGQISRKYTLKTLDLIQRHQPWLIINGRLGDGVGGEFGTPEQTLGAFNLKEPWESCITMTGDAWFWNGGKDYKTASTCLRYLVSCACGDGNLLLDVGPRPDGRIDERAAANYRAMGSWLNQYGQTIRGTRGGPFKPGRWGGSTRTAQYIYLHITETLENKQLILPALPAKITGARMLTGGTVQFQQTAGALELRFSEQAPVDTIVELTLDGDALSLVPIETERPGARSLTDDATGSSSSDRGLNASCLVHHAWEKDGVTLHFGEPGYEEQQAALAKKPNPQQKGFGWGHNHLGHPFRYWQAAKDDSAPWVELALAAEKTFSEICLAENHGYTAAFACDAFTQGAWTPLFTAGEMGLYNRRLAKPVTATKLRIRFLKTTGPVALSSIMLY
jgi:alpha-L-fucosidase